MAKEWTYRRCSKRRLVNGVQMCYAIGCCEIGDMPCQCEVCDWQYCKDSDGDGNPLTFATLVPHQNQRVSPKKHCFRKQDLGKRKVRFDQ